MALIEGCKHSLSLEIPADAVAAATEIAAAGIQAKVRLPGFRPGKAPLNIVKSRFAAEIRQEALDSLLPKYFTEAVKKEHLEVVSQPTVKDLHFHAGEPVKFVAEFEVAPTFDLGEYRGLVCTYSEPEVTEEDLTKRIDQLRDSKAEFVNEEPRALVDGVNAAGARRVLDDARKDTVASQLRESGALVARDKTKIDAPLPDTSFILSCGMNSHAHVKEI